MSTTRGSNGSTQAPPPFKRECGTGCDPADELEVVKEDLRRITAELSVIKALMVSHAVKHGSYCQKDDVEGLPCRCGLDEAIAKLGCDEPDDV